VPLYAEISRLPWIVQAPGILPGRTDAIVQPPDIMATLLDYAGAEAPRGMDGKSMRAVIEGERHEHRDVAVSSPAIQEGGRGNVQPAVTDGRWAYYPVGLPLESAAGRRGDHAVDGVEKRKAAEAYEPLLFDRQEDPAEERNVLASNRARAEELHGRFVELLGEWNTDPRYVAAWRRGRADSLLEDQ
jgi:arylsulfatase A-like enzyme